MTFFKLYSLVILSGLLLWGVVIWMQTGKPTKSSQWIWEAYVKKETYASSLQSPKIVLVAGSNALFGVDSKMLSHALGYPVINNAVNAGIGLPPILMQAKRVIVAHDIVILPLEYPLYSYMPKPGVQMIDYLYARAPYMIAKLTLREQLYMFWHVKMARLRVGYNDGKDVPLTRGLYGAHNINTRGDQIHTSRAQQTKGMKQEIAVHEQNPETYGKTYRSDASGWEYLSDFVQWCKRQNVTVIFMPSTLMYHHTYKDAPKEKWLYENIGNEVKKRGWDFVGKPYTYMYESNLYFNTNFHLTHEGRVKNTQQMIEDLKLSKFADIFQREKM